MGAFGRVPAAHLGGDGEIHGHAVPSGECKCRGWYHGRWIYHALTPFPGMFYLLLQTWIWILAAGLFGLLVGWLTWGRQRARGGSAESVASLKRELSASRKRYAELAASRDGSLMDASLALEAGNSDVVALAGGDAPGSNSTRPPGLSAPREGGADDLQRIRGIGPVIERLMNDLGVYHFDQIAAFTPENIRWVDSYLVFPGRIHREQWVLQAAGLAKEKAGAGSVRPSSAQ